MYIVHFSHYTLCSTHYAVHRQHIATANHITHSEVECKSNEHLILMVTTYLIVSSPRVQGGARILYLLGNPRHLGGSHLYPIYPGQFIFHLSHGLNDPIYFSFISRDDIGWGVGISLLSHSSSGISQGNLYPTMSRSHIIKAQSGMMSYFR